MMACKSNLKNIGTALEMYSTDHGAYPRELTELTPTYLKTVPTCPNGKSYGTDISEEEYLIFCAGGWHGKTRSSDIHSTKHHTHSKTRPRSPAYSSTEGVLPDKVLFTVENSDRKSKAYLVACKNILASGIVITVLLVLWRAIRRRYNLRCRTLSEL